MNKTIKGVLNRITKILLPDDYQKIYLLRSKLYSQFLLANKNSDNINEVIAATRFLSPTDVEVKECPEYKNILILAPHQDDDIIGCGGTLLKSSKSGADVHTIYLTDGASPKMTGKSRTQYINIRNQEAEKVWEKLNGSKPTFMNLPTRQDIDVNATIIQLRKLIIERNPDCVFVPHFLELPSDHKRTAYLFAEVLRTTPKLNIQEVWSYQVTSMIAPNIGIDITDVEQTKYDLMLLWESQNKMFNYAHRARGLNAANTFYTQYTKSSHTNPYIELFFVTAPKQYIELINSFYENEALF